MPKPLGNIALQISFKKMLEFGRIIICVNATVYGPELNVREPNLRISIQTLLLAGTAQREISRVTGVDRKTVRRYAPKANSPGWPRLSCARRTLIQRSLGAERDQHGRDSFLDVHRIQQFFQGSYLSLRGLHHIGSRAWG